MDGVREVHDLDADPGELLLEAEALLGAAPVVALEEHVEPQLAPGIELVGEHLGDRLVDVADVAHYLEPFREGHDGGDALGLPQHLVGDDTGDQVVAPVLGVAEDVEVADMEEVEGASGIADTGHGNRGSLLGYGRRIGTRRRIRATIPRNDAWRNIRCQVPGARCRVPGAGCWVLGAGSRRSSRSSPRSRRPRS